MESLQTAIHKFYNQFELHIVKIEEIKKKASKPCNSILNQSALLRTVIPTDSLQGTSFVDFPGYRNLLISSITSSLEKELPILKEIREELHSANEELAQKQQILENTYHNLKSKKLIDLSVINPSSPCFEHITDWSSDIWRYYYAYYLQVSQAVKTLNYEDETSVNALLSSFKEDAALKKQIIYIKSYRLDLFNFIN